MAMDLEEQVIELGKNVFALEKENELQARIYVKIEDAMGKMQDLTESMHRLLSVHDERIKVNAAVVDTIKAEMNSEIKELEERITRETQNLAQKIDSSESRILEKFAELQKKWEDDNKTQAVKKETFADKVATLNLQFTSWKYFLIGGVFVAGMILQKTGALSGLFNLFKMP